MTSKVSKSNDKDVKINKIVSVDTDIGFDSEIEDEIKRLTKK